MMMIKLFIALFSFNTLATPDSLQVQTNIQSVTVFKKGALVNREAELTTLSNTTEIFIDKLDPHIDAKSIELISDDGLEIISVKKEIYTDTIADFSATYDSYNTEIKKLTDSIRLYQSFSRVLDQEKKLFHENKDFSSETEGVDIDKLEKASKLYMTRLRQIEIESFEIGLTISDFQEQVSKLNASRNQLNQVNDYLRVRILVKPLASGPQSLSLQYYTSKAGWSPYYDARVSDKQTSMRLDLKANVFQTTGETWDQVKLTLTNSNPSKSQTPPIINPFFLNKYTDMIAYNPSTLGGNNATGYIYDRNGEPLIGANVIVSGTNHGTITDFDGQFNLNGVAGQLLEISYTGYNTKKLVFNPSNPVIFLDEGMLLEEVVVSGISEDISIRGSRAKSSAYYIDGIRVNSQEQKKRERQVVAVSKSESFTSVNYALETPYTIKSSKDASEVLLDKKDVSVDYYYQILPRLSKDAFLMASIPNWEEYDLLPAPVNIYHNTTFKGNTHINPEFISDTLELSIGVDPEVVIQREQLKDFTKKNFLKNKISEEMAWEISVRNSKRKAIKIKIKDQYPVSNDKSIDVDLLESGSAKIDEKRGLLEWELDLQKGETFKNNIIYKVKYPSGQELVLI